MKIFEICKNKLKSWKDFIQSKLNHIRLIIVSKFPSLNRTRFSLFIGFLLSILAFILLIVGIKSLTDYAEPIFKILAENFSKLAVGVSFSVFMRCLAMFYVIGIGIFILNSFFNKKTKWVAFFMVASTITVFLVGVVFIDAIVGVPNAKWMLYDRNHNYIADVECKDLQGRLIYEHIITCSVLPHDFEIKKLNGGEVHITQHNYSFEIIPLENDILRFMPPNNIAKVVTIFNVTTMENKNLRLESSFPPKFYTIEEDRQREKDFLTYFFALLFISIFTIPQFVLKISEAINNE